MPRPPPGNSSFPPAPTDRYHRDVNGPERIVCTVALAAGSLALGWLARWDGPVRRDHGTLDQQAYVWQREWTDPVEQAIAQAPPQLRRLVVLHAELTFRIRGDGVLTTDVAAAEVRWDALARSQWQVGLAIRVRSFAGPFSQDGQAVDVLERVARNGIDQANRAGLSVAEVQIDFDAASRQLRNYARWIRGLRKRLAPLPVTFTALASWTRQADFPELARAGDGFVLQVHGLDPQRPDAVIRPAEATQAVERAALAGVDFKVALPTYGHLVARDAAGTLVGIASEGPEPNWPADATVAVVQAQPNEMVALVRRWQADRPARLTGVVWYRLPVVGDRLNWHAETFAQVTETTRVEPILEVRIPRPERGLVEIDLHNAGTDQALLESPIALRWTGGRLLASDALNGYAWVDADGPAATLNPPETWPINRLQPGETRKIAWLRFEPGSDAKVEVHVDQ